MFRHYLYLILIAGGPAVANADGPRFDALLRNGQRSAGVVTGDLANGFQFQSPATGAVSLDKIESLDLPLLPRSLPDRGWKRLTLINGDVLHAKPNPALAACAKSPPRPMSVEWFANFKSTACLPFASLAQISHPTGTRCVVYQDFETDSAGWRNRTGGNIRLDRKQARSGMLSLHCSVDEPVLKYELAESMESGWLEFSFFLGADWRAQGPCRAAIQIAAGQTQHELQVTLAGESGWYEVEVPGVGNWQRQRIPRRSGWHTLIVAVQPGLMRLTVDDYPLAEGQILSLERPQLTALKVTATEALSDVWIDDFAVTQAIAELRPDVHDRAQDQVDLATGDQLFGKIIELRSQSLVLLANSQHTELQWPDLSGLHFADTPVESRLVTGRIVHIQLQPWSNTSRESVSDSLSGAMMAIGSQFCTLDHPQCGRCDIPWRHIRCLRPAFYGQQCTLIGRPVHLGDEVKSAMQSKIPDGTSLIRDINLDNIPDGAAYISLVAADLEPAGKGTLDHPWLKRLRAGELSSELWLNDRRISILNTEVTGRGIARQPHRLRIPVSIKALQPGQNRLEIRLKPSRGEPVEYDDWELTDWRFELETKLPLSATPVTK